MHELHREPQDPVERYLERLDRVLATLSARERAKIIREARRDIADRVASRDGEWSVARVLDELGEPVEYAQTFITPERRTSLGPIARLYHAGHTRLAGLLTVGTLAFGYASSLLFIALAIVKLIHPDRVGLWLDRASGDWFLAVVPLGDRPAGEEVLGWWFVPIVLSAVVVLYHGTRLFRAQMAELRRAL